VNRRAAFWAATVAGCYILQVVFLPLVALRGVTPNLMLLAVLYFAVHRGPAAGVWLGFSWGILSDVAGLSLFGSQAFILTAIGYGAGRLQGKVDEEKYPAQVVLVLAASLAHVAGVACLEAIFEGSVQRWRAAVSAAQPLYSVFICPLVFWLLKLWQKAFLRQEVRPYS